MDTKAAELAVDAARNKIEAAEAELAEAQLELAKAQVAPAALETLKALKETSHLVWKICNLKDWDDESKALYEKAQSFEDELATTLLGAGDRRRKLFELDPERWPLEGEYKTRAGYYPTDESVSYAIATMIFDKGFGRGHNKAYEEMSAVDKARWRALKDRAEDILGAVGTEGFELWRKGRHDT